MSNGIVDLRRYQEGREEPFKSYEPPDFSDLDSVLDRLGDRQEIQKRWVRRDAPSEKRGGIASLIQNLKEHAQREISYAQGMMRNNPLSKLRRVAPLFLGERSETGMIEGHPEISEAIYNTISPYGYTGKDDQLRLAMQRIARGESGPSPRGRRRSWWHSGGAGPLTTETAYERNPDRPYDRSSAEAFRYQTSDPLEDAWRMYLGLDQLYDSFKESEFRPTISTGEDISYQDFVSPESRASLSRSWHDTDQGYPTIRNLITELDDSGTVHKKDPLLNTYTLSKGEDERGPYVSYYDKWDLVPEFKGMNVANISRAGRPFDIYGRMHYDPDTYELLSASDE